MGFIRQPDSLCSLSRPLNGTKDAFGPGEFLSDAAKWYSTLTIGEECPKVAFAWRLKHDASAVVEMGDPLTRAEGDLS